MNNRLRQRPHNRMTLLIWMNAIEAGGYDVRRTSSKTLVFYRDRPVGGVAWAWLCGAVTIEPFEGSLWGGGCGGLLWDCNHAGSLTRSRGGWLRGGAADIPGGWECGGGVRWRPQG